MMLGCCKREGQVQTGLDASCARLPSTLLWLKFGQKKGTSKGHNLAQTKTLCIQSRWQSESILSPRPQTLLSEEKDTCLSLPSRPNHYNKCYPESPCPAVTGPDHHQECVSAVAPPQFPKRGDLQSGLTSRTAL